MIRTLATTLLALASSFYCFGQQSDSLWTVWNGAAMPDSSRLNAMNELAWELLFSNPDSAYTLASLEQDLATDVKSSKWEASAHNVKGISYWVKGDYDNAIAHYDTSATIKKASGDRKGLAGTYNNIGGVYQSQGHYPKAIKFFLKSVEIKKELDDKKGIATTYHNIGFIYRDQGEDSIAMDYYTQSLALRIELNDSAGIAASRNNIGMLHIDRKEYSKAIAEYETSLQIYSAQNDTRGMAFCYGNLGSAYRELQELATAEGYFMQSHVLRLNMNDNKMLARSFSDLGTLRVDQKLYNQAIELCLEGFAIGSEIEVLEEVKLNCKCLADAYEGTRDFEKALEFNKRFNDIKDSLISQEKVKEITTYKLQHEFRQEQFADSTRTAQEKLERKLLHDQEMREQKTYTYAGIFGCFGLLVISVLIFRGYRQKRKNNELLAEKNEEISMQRDIVEMKNQEITDSITYAKSLQDAILPPMKLVHQYLPDSFILYKPKAIVAGDFYWFEKVNDTILFAAADCTGHGVPGAMVSMVCHNALNRAVKELELTEPAKILDSTAQQIAATFEKGETEVRDGMDIALCALNTKTRELQYSGAFNPLWCVQKAQEPENRKVLFNETHQLTEIDADRQPIGKYALREPFTNVSLQLSKGDTIYIFSDGFADQFGGAKGKKLKILPFKQMLLSIQQLTMPEQHSKLDEAFEQWKGDFEQIDDVCVIGVRV